MSNETAVATTSPTTVSAYIKSPQLIQGLTSLLGDEQKAKRFARAVVTTLQAQPKLAKCDKQSFQIACMHAAFANLPPGPMGLSAIVPYGRDCQFQVMYRGLAQLIWRSGDVAVIETRIKYQGDILEDEIIGVAPRHKRGPHSGDWNFAEGCYAAIQVKGGGWIYEFWPKAKIEAHRDQYSKAYNYAESKGKKDSPWHTAAEPMWKKTLLKVVGKLAPISEEAQQAISADDMAEVGVPVIDVSQQIQERTEETLDEIAAQLGVGEEVVEAEVAEEPEDKKQARQQAKERYELALVDAVSLGLIETEAAGWNDLLERSGRAGKGYLTAEDFEAGTDHLIEMAVPAPESDRPVNSPHADDLFD